MLAPFELILHQFSLFQAISASHRVRFGAVWAQIPARYTAHFTKDISPPFSAFLMIFLLLFWPKSHFERVILFFEQARLVQDNGMELVYKLYIEHWVYGLVPYRVDIASAWPTVHSFSIEVHSG